MSEVIENKCPLCEIPTPPQNRDPVRRSVINVDCRNCGRFGIDERQILSWSKKTHENALISYAVRKRQDTTGDILLTEAWLDDILKNTALPLPAEQAENLIRSIADSLKRKGAGVFVRVVPRYWTARIGALNEDGVQYIRDGLLAEDLLEMGKDATLANQSGARLSFHGWERYEELKRKSTNSRLAFMAMQFGDHELNNVFENCFHPAADRAGYSLEKMDDKPEPGIIDVRMEVEIRRSRFVVADLTHQNRGAYWEAGFATALD